MAQILQPITITASTTLNRKSHAETWLLISKLDGLTLTLPASEGKGAKYRVYVKTTVTSVGYKVQVANGTDIFQGGVSLSTDIGGTNMLASATSDTITMNGSTTGGLIGSYVEFTDVSTGFWLVNGFLVTTGAEGDPFTAAVS